MPALAPDTPLLSLTRRQSRTSWAFFFVLWLLYACIGPGPTVTSPNTVSRLALPFVMLQQDSLEIDAFAPYTIDRAMVGGHVFLDKLPGQSLMALPAVAGAILVGQARGAAVAPLDGTGPTGFFDLCVWLAVAITSAPLAAAGAASVYRCALRLGFGEPAARVAGLLLGLCTPFLGWATVLFSHVMAGGMLILAFEAMLLLTLGPRPRPRPGSRPLLAVVTGLLMAAALTTELVTAVPLFLMTLAGLWLIVRQHPRQVTRSLLSAALPMMAGGLVGLLPLALYNQVAFGSPLTLGYSNVVGFDGMQTGFFGIALPRPWVLVSILAAPRKGILWLSPVLAAVPFAWAATLRRSPGPVGLVLLGVPAFYLVLNSGYYYWDGGGSTGPRHIVAALPFICLAFAPLWARAPRARPLLAAGMALGAASSLAWAVVDMNADARILWPLRDILLPHLLTGDVHGVFAAAGLPGLWSVIPIGLVALVAAWIVWPADAGPESAR